MPVGYSAVTPGNFELHRSASHMQVLTLRVLRERR